MIRSILCSTLRSNNPEHATTDRPKNYKPERTVAEATSCVDKMESNNSSSFYKAAVEIVFFDYCNLEYSVSAAVRMGISRSASFQRVRNS
jgi:hypothetical protein